jgi:predicted sulfurtransferase
MDSSAPPPSNAGPISRQDNPGAMAKVPAMSESQNEQCTQEWVRQELILWEEGINARIAELRSEVEQLTQKLEDLASKQSSVESSLADLTGLS